MNIYEEEWEWFDLIDTDVKLDMLMQYLGNDKMNTIVSDLYCMYDGDDYKYSKKKNAFNFPNPFNR